MNIFLLKMLLPLFLTLAVYGQFEQGSIVGTVTDPQQAPIANASVQIRSKSTNVSREVATAGGGEYNSLPLPPGAYVVTIHQPGFKERSIEVNVGVSQRLQLDFALELGSVIGKVVVEGHPAAIETESSDLGQVKTGTGNC